MVPLLITPLAEVFSAAHVTGKNNRLGRLRRWGKTDCRVGDKPLLAMTVEMSQVKNILQRPPCVKGAGCAADWGIVGLRK